MAKKKLNTQEEVTAPLRIRLFGRLELENQWGRAAEDTSRPSLSWLLLKYLLVNPDRGVTGEELREAVWPDRGTERAGADRVRLHRLRKALEPLHLDGQNGLVLFHTATYQINPDCDVTFDTDELAELLARLRTIPADDPVGLELCGQGLELFQGPLLACTGPAPWVERLRGVYRDRFRELAETTLERMEALGDSGLAELLCRRTAAIAPEDRELCGAVERYLVREKKKSALGRFVNYLASNRYLDTEEEMDMKNKFDLPLPKVTSPYEVNVRLFGQLELENQWGRAAENPSHPSYSWSLLKYLLVNAGREVPLEELLDTVWPDDPDINTGYAANIRLRRLREALAPLRLHGKTGLVLYENGRYALNPDYSLRTDAGEVFDLLAAEGDALSSPDTQPVEQTEGHRGASSP